MKDLFGNISTGACFCKKKNHRYYLFRIWNEEKPLVAFIGLNPSKANDIKNDNTITKVIKIAAHNGYGGLYMFNLFPFISTNPDELDGTDLGTNDLHIERNCRHWPMKGARIKDVVFCWGNFNVHGRDHVMKNLFPSALCLAKNKNGSPKHPLYCKDSTWLVFFNPPTPEQYFTSQS